MRVGARHIYVMDIRTEELGEMSAWLAVTHPATTVSCVGIERNSCIL